MLLVVIMVLVSLTACGSTKTAGPDGTDETKEQTKQNTSDATLTVAIWDKNQEPGLKQIMDDFTEQTGIKCDIQITPWKDYWTMLEVATTGGNMPDVFWMHAFQVNTYAQYDDILLDISDKISTSDKIDISKFPEAFVKLYQNSNGKQIGIPKDVDTSAVWYNKDMFDEAGIPYPTADWTWEDFREICKKLTKPDGSQYGLAMKPGRYYDRVYFAHFCINDTEKYEPKRKISEYSISCKSSVGILGLYRSFLYHE